MITVQDILNAEVFKDSQVIAGRNGLSRELSTITIAEVPDSANWLRGGELVCTTAFFVSNQVTHQQEWIESIIGNGASALVIKASRFLGVVPEAIVEVANRHHFPIISVAHEVTWPVVIEEFMDFFMNERMKIMQQVEEIQSDLTSLVLENASLDTIVGRIAQLIGNPVILEDANLQMISTGIPKSDLTAFEIEVLEERKTEDFKSRIVNTKFYRNIHQGVVDTQQETIISQKDEKRIKNIMIPVYSNKSIYGYLSMIDLKNPHLPIDRIILKTSTTALALSLMQQYVNKQTFRKKNLALIEDIISGRIHTKVVYDEDFLDINWSNPMAAIMIEVVGFNEDGNRVNDQYEELIYRMTQNHLKKYFGQVIIGNVGSLFTVLVSFNPKKVKEMPSVLKEIIGKLKSDLEEQFGKEKVLIGVGGAYTTLNLVSRSYKEANMALSVVRKFIWKGTLMFSDDIGIYRIFSMIENHEEIEDFCNSYLEDLKKYDKEHGNVLLETLHVFLLSDSSIKATAEKMFLHPNTVSYRIKKVKGIIGNELNSPEFKLAYLFALESNILLNQ